MFQNRSSRTSVSASAAARTTTTTTMKILAVVAIAIVSVSSTPPYVSGVAATDCERLNSQLSYTQEEAPRDLSGLLPAVIERVNRVLDSVVDVQVDWQGADLQGKVGQHIVECTVTRLASAIRDTDENVSRFVDEFGREVASKCFYLPFTIIDTNECSLPAKHPMRHACPAPSICVNTEGSYECLCPRLGEGESSSGSDTWVPPSTADETFWTEVQNSDRTPWELSFSSRSMTSCPSMSSTYGCCPEKYTAEGKKCREDFHCPVDPCQSRENDCAPNAVCVRTDNPSSNPDHTCQCPDGLMGNGKSCKPTDPAPKPMLMYDGVTPTDLTRKNNFYCGCTKPTIDACSGFPPCKGKHEICTVTSGNQPKCACKPGFVQTENYGCVDSNPPKMKLLNDPHGDGVMRLKQGDEYKESMVEIVDANAEDYQRSLKVAYSKPLPPGCLTSIGEFTVTYTISLPWASPPYVSIDRKVIIEDIDECALDVDKYKRVCPQLIPKCDKAAGATCRNVIGSYTCQCPANTSGDGFMKNASFADDQPTPSSYKGGTSCVDTTKPVLTLKGPMRKIFKIATCGGLVGVMKSTKDDDEDKELQGQQRKMYEGDIRDMIRATAGAELCATHDSPNPKPIDCVDAVDHTYKGDVDLSDAVVVGEPVAKGPLHWVVPYDVQDAAGNKATTVYRDIIVQEVNLMSFEKKIREEVAKEKQENLKKEIDFAVQQERKKWERENKGRNRRDSTSKTCPACPPCECSGSEVNAASCTAYCTYLSESCKLSDESWAFYILSVLEAYFSPSSVPIICLGFLAVIVWVLVNGLRSIFRPISVGSSYDYQKKTYDDDDVLNGGRGPPPQAAAAAGTPARPVAATNGASGSFFSPAGIPTASMSMNGAQAFGSPPGTINGTTPGSSRQYQDRFVQSPLITPSKRGDRRRTPYSNYT
mmetsp:Transcript_52100/g.125807  ORF Transcript_52100/g.125807 Transcript_52100/m.125807 type:complete len:930 (+) Transcript_52100:143-2932(+)